MALARMIAADEGPLKPLLLIPSLQGLTGVVSQSHNTLMAIEWFEQAQAASEDVLPILKALADPMRLAVFQCIRGCGGSAGYEVATGYCDGATDGGVSLCDVRCRMPCTASTLTHHLNVLRDAGLIETQKRGRMVYAWIRHDAIVRAAAFFALETK